MHIDAYQNLTGNTAQYPADTTEQAVTYCAMGLAGEAGEVANKVKKIMRGDVTLYDQNDAIVDELGDCLWYIAQLADQLGINLSDVAGRNLRKLQDRQTRKAIKGNGDLR